MRFVDAKAVQAVLAANGLHAGQASPDFVAYPVLVALDREFHDVVPAKAGDQLGWGSLGDDLAIVDDGNSIAQTLGLVHVMRGQEHGAAATLKLAHNVPQLAAALRIK